MGRVSTVLALTAVLVVLVSALHADPFVRLDGYQDLGGGQYQYSYFIDNTTGSLSIDSFYLLDINQLIDVPFKLDWSGIALSTGTSSDVATWSAVDPVANAVPAGGALGGFDIITGTELGEGGTSGWVLSNSLQQDEGTQVVWEGTVDNNNVTPEASTWALLLSSTGLVGLIRRRRTRVVEAA